MVKELTQYNIGPIIVSAKELTKKKSRFHLSREKLIPENLARLVNIHENGNATDHSLSDFTVIISSSLLTELGVKLVINKTVVEFTFRGAAERS